MKFLRVSEPREAAMAYSCTAYGESLLQLPVENDYCSY